MNLFDVLPNEILEKVLDPIVSRENISLLKLVCKRFKEVVERIYDYSGDAGRHFQWNALYGYTNEINRLLQDDRVFKDACVYKYFYYVVVSGDLQMVQSIIDDPRIDPNLYPNHDGYHPLVTAYLLGKMDVFEFLFSHPKVDRLYSWDYIHEVYNSHSCLGLLERIVLSDRLHTSDTAKTFNELKIIAYCYGRVKLWQHLAIQCPNTIEKIYNIVKTRNQYNIWNEEVLELILDDKIVQLASVQYKTEIYEIAMMACCERGFIKTAQKILDKDVIIYHLSITNLTNYDSNVLRVLLKSIPYLECSWHMLVLLEDIEIIQLALENLKDARFWLFRTALLDKKKDIASYIVRQSGRNMSLRKNPFDPCIFDGIELDMVRFALEDLKICLPNIQCRQLLSHVCKRRNNQLLQVLLGNEMFFNQLPISLLKQELLPFLIVNDRKELADCLYKSIKPFS